jgi:hypothetical protein
MSLGDIDDLMAGRIPKDESPYMPNVAVKHDTGKPPMSLISRTALIEEAKVLAFGKDKYGAHNWRAGMDFSRLMDACLRHVYAFADGEDLDSETGLSHLAHARCCLAFLLEYQGKRLGTDDRYGR